MANVRFYSVKLKENYNALATKDELALYWIEETKELYKGATLFGTGAAATALAAGLMSAEDKAKLDALVNDGGLSGLVPVDGTIVIADAANGGKSVGVAISKQAGNTLVAVSDGLFVPAAEKVSVPEYAIEKQATAEDGYSASYKLKKTVDGQVSYVGDTINIAKDMMLQSATLETVAETDVPYAGAVIGDPYIKMVFNDANASNIYIPVKGLVDTYTAGNGIEIVDGVIGVKLATNTHGLVAVNGELSLALATKTADGAMSKEDKKFIDAIPSVYVAKKYEIANTPVGTLVNYGEDEIRIMCPSNAQFVKQSVGEGGDSNTYYVTFKTYAPNADAVGYIEHLGDKVDSEILTNFSVDEHGRRYQPTWLGIAKYDETTGVWAYYGANSSADKFIGWDYQIDWYNTNGVMIASDCIRINLSNEECHNSKKPYYMAGYATDAEVDGLRDSIEDIQDSFTWGTLE